MIRRSDEAGDGVGAPVVSHGRTGRPLVILTKSHGDKWRGRLSSRSESVVAAESDRTRKDEIEMSLLRENAKRASRGLRAAFVDGTPPPWPGNYHLVLEGITEILRDLMHTSDRYSFDLRQILTAATFRYASDQLSMDPNPYEVAEPELLRGLDSD